MPRVGDDVIEAQTDMTYDSEAHIPTGAVLKYVCNSQHSVKGSLGRYRYHKILMGLQDMQRLDDAYDLVSVVEWGLEMSEVEDCA